MIAIATRYAAAPGIARTAKAYVFAEAWSELDHFLATKHEASIHEVEATIEALFGDLPTNLLANERLIADDIRAADSVVAVNIVKAEQRAGYGLATAVVRLTELMRAIVRKDARVPPPSDARRWALVLPPKIFPLPGPLTPKPQTPPSDGRAKEIAAIKTRLAASKAALE